ncbi:MAG: fibronectin type III domain-containing protein [Flavobacteriales bacterium]|nr:fibronectin type III domain-containing protein [Flavobacteriales bacterium]
MQKQENAKLGLASLTPTALVEKGRNHVESCTGNPDITLPTDFLKELGDACDALDAANIAVQNNGGKQDRSRRAARVTELEAIIRLLAKHVEVQCGGIAEKILSTGFDLRKPRQPVGVLDAPPNLRAERGKQRGDVVLRWGAKRGRTTYSLQVNSGDPKLEEDWRWAASTTRNTYTLTGLETDKQYYFRVRANSTAGAGKLSDVAASKAA